MENVRILDNLRHQVLPVGQPNFCLGILPPLRSHRTQAILVSEHLLESHEVLWIQISRRPCCLIYRFWFWSGPHNQYWDRLHAGNGGVSHSVTLLKYDINGLISSLNSTTHSVATSNSTQSGVFDSAVKLEEGRQEPFGTKTVVTSSSHEGLSEKS